MKRLILLIGISIFIVMLFNGIIDIARADYEIEHPEQMQDPMEMYNKRVDRINEQKLQQWQQLNAMQLNETLNEIDKDLQDRNIYDIRTDDYEYAE
jgi:hypothetical protein